MVYHDINDLHHQPGNDNVGDRYLEYVSSFELVKYRQLLASLRPLLQIRLHAQPENDKAPLVFDLSMNSFEQEFEPGDIS